MRKWLFAYLFLFALSVSAQPVVEIDQPDRSYALLDSSWFIQENGTPFTPQQVLTLSAEELNSLKAAADAKLVDRENSFWAIVKVKSSLQEEFRGVLSVNHPSDSVELFVYDSLGELVHTDLSGRMVKQSEKSLGRGTQRDVYLPITLSPSAHYTLLLRIHNSTGLSVSLANAHISGRIAWSEQYIERSDFLNLVLGIMIGMMGLLSIYNLLIYFSSGDKIYLYYSIYIFLPLVYGALYLGGLNDTIFGESKLLYFYARSLVAPLTMVVYMQFIRLFLDTPENFKKWDRVLKILIGAELLSVLFIICTVPTFNAFYFRRIPVLIHLPVLLTALALLVRLATSNKNRVNRKIALYFITGVGSFFAGALFFIFVIVTEVFPLEVGFLGQVVGIAVELVAYSLGLGYRIKLLEKDRRRAQEETAELLEEQNEKLERSVTERTMELAQQKEEVLTQNEELRQQQEEIVTQRDYIAQQNGELSNKNQEILSSIRYAQTIQEAILPAREKIFEAFHQDMFLLFRPKDIISGDFFWYENIDGVKFVAVADCTGHGVPGAFMSMIGVSFLNEEIVKYRRRDPAEILTNMHIHLKEVLRQNEQGGNQDGMDIALCVIEEVPEGNKITFAGAKRPLYYASQSDSVIQEIKGDRLAIGGFQGRNKSFSNREVVLPIGTAIYLTTDGFIDQHSKQGKKIGSLRLREILTNMHHMTMEEQEQIIASQLDQHQNGQFQRDDITVMGIRL